jgi:hypothetical protein
MQIMRFFIELICNFNHRIRILFRDVFMINEKKKVKNN